MMGRPPVEKHGTYAYGRRIKCKCQPCRAAVSKYQKGYNVDRARGIKRRLPAEPVRAHIQELLDAGVQPCQIYNAAGVAETVYDHLMNGTQGRPPAEVVYAHTAERFLAVEWGDAVEGFALVDSIGIRRRFQALQYRGHTATAIAEAVGVSVAAIYQQMHSERCKTITLAAFHEGYLLLRDHDGTGEHARWAAYRKGWFPPMSWDDETIDDPETKPYPPACIFGDCRKPAASMNLCRAHHDAVSRAGGLKEPKRFRPMVKKLGEQMSIHDRQRLVEEIRELRSYGLDTHEQVADRLGLAKTTVQKAWRDSDVAR